MNPFIMVGSDSLGYDDGPPFIQNKLDKEKRRHPPWNEKQKGALYNNRVVHESHLNAIVGGS